MEIRRALVAFANEPEVRIMSIACGSAEAMIKVVSQLKRKGITVKVLLVDISPEALVYAQQLAERYDVRERVQTLQANALKSLDFANDFKPHVVEMLGLLDYLPKKTAVRLSSQIRRSLMPGGLYLTCNIRHNFEQHFLKWVINWPMIYRSPRELADVIEASGFDDFRLIYEPLEIHGIVVAHKKA
jgi:SAM-dependent methyltransferase